MSDAFEEDRLARVTALVGGHTEQGAVPGLVWALAKGDEVHVGVSGVQALDGPAMARDSIFRISSMTKPIVAAAALVLVEQCRLRLDEPVDEFLPELADRQVLVRADGPIDETVPADRPTSLRDLLTFRLGWGMDFANWGNQSVLQAAEELGIAAGPPDPQGPPPPDEWIRLMGTLPLEHQPGERWLYNTGADVLGVLIARVCGTSLEDAMEELILGPLAMVDTGFDVPADKLARFGPCYGTDPESGARFTYDETDGKWARPARFPAGGGGLVSTVDDYLTFATMLRNRGHHQGHQLLGPASIEAMTTNQLTDAQVATGPTPDGSAGWGFGVGVLVTRPGITQHAGSYGWSGGMGSQWSNDPTSDLIGILMTNQMWAGPSPEPLVNQDFWTTAYAALR